MLKNGIITARENLKSSIEEANCQIIEHLAEAANYEMQRSM